MGETLKSERDGLFEFLQFFSQSQRSCRGGACTRSHSGREAMPDGFIWTSYFLADATTRPDAISGTLLIFGHYTASVRHPSGRPPSSLPLPTPLVCTRLLSYLNFPMYIYMQMQCNVHSSPAIRTAQVAQTVLIDASYVKSIRKS